MSSEATGLGTHAAEIELRDRLIDLLGVATDERIHSDAFWSIGREQVRQGLREIAMRALGSGRDVVVEFEGERQPPA